MIKKNITTLNKVLCLLILGSNFIYFIPRTVSMFGWLESGIINSYFYLLVPINLLIFIFGLISIIAFRKSNTLKVNTIIFALNCLGLLLIIFFAPFIK